MLQQVLESAAVTVVLTQGTIFRPLRERGPKLWRELVSCPLCLGWWIGAAGIGCNDHFGLEPLAAFWHVAASGALAGSTALLFRRLTDWLDSNT